MAYTPHQRAQALVALEANGGNIKKTSIELGIGQATLKAWVTENNDIKSPMGIETAVALPETRDEFIAELKTTRNQMLRLFASKLDDLKARELAVAIGIFIDKTELLEGNATTRTAVIGNGETVDEAIQRLNSELESRISRRAISEVVSSDGGSSESEPTTA